jgi:polar amino acid transport system substrate-binding protein
MPVLLALCCLPAQPAAAQALNCVATNFTRLVEQDGPGSSPRGAIIDTVAAIERVSGLTISVKIQPWARALLETTNGLHDCVLGPYKSVERIAALDFIDLPIYRDFLVLVTREHETFGWNGSLASMAGQRVVLINGWYYGLAMETELPELSITIANTADQGLLMVANRRADIVALTERDARGGIDRLDLGQSLNLLRPPFGSRAGYIALTRKHDLGAAREKLEAALVTLRQSGEQATILARYGLHLNDAGIDTTPLPAAATPSN